MPTVKVNDIEVEVPPGTNMIEAAAKAGVEIPHYCYHPHLSIAGNCRMCLVDVEAGGRGPDIACNMQARDGLHIRTDTERVRTMRKSVMEFLLVNHPLDCPICDQSGECRLQDYYMEHGQHDSRLADAKVGKGKRQDIGEHIVLDAERCVQCSRCVRFSDEVTGTGELRLFNRTNHTQIGVFPGTRLEHDYQGNLADICPVGALTNKDFRFKKRVWWLKETSSVCTGCATGCNIKVCHQDDEVFRYIPRRNDEVNRSWICDPGRLSYKQLASMKRLIVFRANGEKVEAAEAYNAAAMSLKEGKVGVVLGARASNEANWVAVQLTRKHLPGARVYVLDGNDPDAIEITDELLIDADKAPNRRGAQLIGALAGVVGDSAALQAALTAGEVDTLLVLQDDAVGRLGALSAKVIYVGAFNNATAKAALVKLPAALAPEQSCTFINRDGRVQRVRRAVRAAGDAVPAWQALNGIAQAFGAAVVGDRATAVFDELARALKPMKGMSWKSLGGGGQVLDLPAPEPTPPSAAQAAPPAK
ncbi:MAG: (2Fe-2S)-binding protein [Alphaproteobacteria bacterium]|nr:(2Fe-2S)-binding protein [Alphaproteobacteria bacterium]MCB9796372.1 (2Fe-2S)-binding protein [Alphaproteobacteria bacterium]